MICRRVWEDVRRHTRSMSFAVRCTLLPCLQASLPTLKSIVEALASNKDFLQQQQEQQPHFSLEELAAFSAGMAAAADAAVQPMPFDDMQQQQILAAAAAGGYGSEWAGVDPALLQSLQSVIAAQQPQQQQQGSFGPEHLSLNWNRRRGSTSMPAVGGNAGYSMEAAAAARARAALSGDPWLGDSAAQGAPAGNRARYGGGGWAEGAPGAGLSGAGAAAHPGTSLYSAFSEPPLRSSQDFWAEVPGGLPQLWQAEPEGMPSAPPPSPRFAHCPNTCVVDSYCEALLLQFSCYDCHV